MAGRGVRLQLKLANTDIFDTFRQVASWVFIGSLHEECRPGEPLFKMGGPDVYVEIDKVKLCYIRLLENHPEWKDKDSVKLFISHLAAWHKAGQPDVAKRM